MQQVDNNSTREFVGFIWVDDQPGIRLSVHATSVADARSKVVSEYVEGYIISLWNEEDENKPRSPQGGDD